MSDRVEAGRSVYARNLGVNGPEAERMMTERAGADFTREVFEAAGGLGWQSPALTERDRSMAVIAALVTQASATSGWRRTCRWPDVTASTSRASPR